MVFVLLALGVEMDEPKVGFLNLTVLALCWASIGGASAK